MNSHVMSGFYQRFCPHLLGQAIKSGVRRNSSCERNRAHAVALVAEVVNQPALRVNCRVAAIDARVRVNALFYGGYQRKHLER